MKKSQPDYKKIYMDIINNKYPQKRILCETILNKRQFSVLDVIRLNALIFGTEDFERFVSNQKHRSYDESTVIEILDYQKHNKLNNTQTADYYNISRNTIAKWKKVFER
ncbi:transposase [Chryseobacterium sp. BLS98]|jgi:transcriptional regulator with AAA-type ATPase domain|uniref:transposase n=1 Tax=Chryseobacterium sp. BLS98 TaxID=885586 RepID=UPI00065AB2CE|nr:transposase [Chryseobacterium sp. BLS98]KMQ62716.1 transposase [Chryseobacterium sp. BLS98]